MQKARQRTRRVEGNDASFKTELEMTEYESCWAARRAIDEYIDYYRLERKHSALGYLSPTQFERLTAARA